MSEAAGRRRRTEWVMLAQVIAAGTAAGFSGKWEPIEALARALDVPYQTPAPSVGARPDDPGDLVSRLYARIGGNPGGDHGRRARGRARGPND